LLPHGGEAALAVPHSLLPPAQPEGKVVDVLKPQKTEQQEQKTVPHTWFLLYRDLNSLFLASMVRNIYATPTSFLSGLSCYTDKKQNKIFLVYKEVESGAVAKSYSEEGLPNIRGNAQIFPQI
jgi:hypothetical protein